MSIRIAKESDIPAMLAIYGPYVEHTTHSFEYDVPCLRSFTQRFYEHTAQFPWLVWEENGKVRGYAYAGQIWERASYRWCAEVSIYLAPEVQGRGIGRALYEALERILKCQGYRRLYAIVTQENTASMAFHQALGYEYLATFDGCGFKFGRWLGTVWLQKEINFNENPNNFPKKWMDCVADFPEFC